MADTPDSQLSKKDRREARVVDRHLPSGYTAGFEGGATVPSASAPDLTEPEEESSLKLQGGDIHRDLFKKGERSKLQSLHQRAATFSHPARQLPVPDNEMPVSEQHQPGGFRREFVVRKQGPFDGSNIPVARNFVEFLDLYGSFAGEDLAESDDEAIVDEEEAHEEPLSETRPLLGRRKSSRVARKGDASTTKTFFTLLKAFIGTGIMFLPKAFKNGGILFSSMTLIAISVISMVAFHLLLQCRAVYQVPGYGEIGQAIGGRRMRALILGSITISQIGFVCAGIVFVAENLLAFLDAVTRGSSPLSTSALIALQLVLLIPLSYIRNISKLGPAALLADVFILIGVGYIFYFDIATLAKQGIHSTVRLFNPQHYTLTIGAAIFTFEGIGLILPIQSSMKNPQKFEPLLALIMFIITTIFTAVGALCYATFGSATQIEIINNYPQDSKLVNSVQFLYSLAVLVGTPVQLFPAIRILEGKFFGTKLSGKRDAATKWKKNAFRTAIVLLSVGISIAGSSNLDRFVALIGSFACVPLVYIYPPLLHYKGVAESRLGKAGDILLMVVGAVGMVYTTVITVVNSFVQN
ncbi:hypothetical protein H2203_000502 [Taxawa tesnikishii (nom. ined.)]|nr:hypothetical protein H2203_000502 [Dothideales sp. JES 119]